MSSPPLLYGYVDETGDRGAKPRSSPFFAMSGVVVEAEREASLRSAIHMFRSKLAVPQAKELGALTSPKVNYVIFEKAALPATSTL